MERLKLRYLDTIKSLKTFQDILKEPFSPIIRDAAICRFEYTFESLWKFLREYLKEKEGEIRNSPKSVFRALFEAKLLNEEETVNFLDMTDDRNNTVHTYREELANQIYGKLIDYYDLMKSLTDRIKL